MGKSNKSTGTEFEVELANKLYESGWWVHLLTQNDNGQPADIIAVKNRDCILVDAKDCKNDIFVLSRIEQNQMSAMDLFQISSDFRAYFALRTSKGISFITYNRMMELLEKGVKRLKIDDIETYSCGYNIL